MRQALHISGNIIGLFPEVLGQLARSPAGPRNRPWQLLQIHRQQRQPLTDVVVKLAGYSSPFFLLRGD